MKLEKKKVVCCIFVGLLLVFSFWKTRIGIHSDEIHSLAVADMIVRGDSFFKDCWFYLQLSSVVSAPLSWIYRMINGSNDGIILYLRIISVVIQFAIAAFMYKTFAKKGSKIYVFAAAVCMFSFVSDFLNFAYKPELVWFTILEICFAYRYFENNRIRNIVGLGISLSLCVLCFPTAVIQAIVWMVIFYCYSRNSGTSRKAVIILPFVCLMCAAVFFVVVLSKITVKELFLFFPEILNDDQLASNFITKLKYPLIKIVELGLLSCIPVIVCKRVGFVKNIVAKLHIPVFTMLLVLAFMGQCFIERLGITWHCITYPYSLTMFFLPMLYIEDKKENDSCDRWGFWSFFSMAWASFLCISLASNQGNITCIYAGVFSTCGFIIYLGNTRNENAIKERTLVSCALVVMALLMYIFPVWDQEAIYPEKYGMRHIFSDRILMTEGPAKGIYVGEEMYDRVSALCNECDEYISESDKVYIVDSGFYTAFGYLHQRGSYATYSPRGSYFDRIVDYYEVNPEKLATVILISKKWIEEKGDAYEAFPDGVALQKLIEEYNYSRIEDEGFIVYKR